MTPAGARAAALGAEPRLGARTAALLADRIADGTLPAGTPLLESRIAALLGTSRGPARRALEMLAERGLVARAPRGYVVTPPAREDASPGGREDVSPEGRGDASPRGRGDASPGGRGDASPGGRGDASPGGRGDASPEGREDASPGGRGDASPGGRGDASPGGRGNSVAGAASALARLDVERLVPAASWQRLYPEVQRSIVARTAFNAWRVVEVDLAEHHRVSRTVVREVLARLHQRGVLRRDDRGRWVAPALSAAHVGERYAVRALLEPAALLLAAPRLPSGLVAGLRARLAEATARAAELDGPALDELEADLHVRLLGHCPNATLMEAVRLHQSLLVAHSFLYGFIPRLFPVEPFLPEHAEILDRLAEGRPDAAAAALRHHLEVSLARAVARIEQVRAAPRPSPLPYLVPLPARS